MTNRQIIYGSLLCGALTAATMPIVDTHPVVIAASFPFAALTFAVVALAGKWLALHLPASNKDGA